jgi:hypothetical protein
MASRLIVSLVYNRGTILASKRASYEDLAVGELDEKALSDRVNRQHKLICAAVKAGRIDDLKGMSKRGVAKANLNGEAVAVADTVVPVVKTAFDSIPEAEPEIAQTLAEEPQPAETVLPEYVLPLSAPHLSLDDVLPPDYFDDAPVIDEVQVIEEIILPAEAVAVVSELSGRERPTDTKLSIELLGDSKFKGGERRTVNIMVCRGTERKVVSGAQIMIKVLGSSFRPVIFHASSDSNGLAKVHLQLPQFQAGRAAILIRAISETQEVELRRVVTPG